MSASSHPVLIPYGPSGWLARWEDEEGFARELPGWVHALEHQAPHGLAEFVPGFQTLLFLFHTALPREAVEDWLSKHSRSAKNFNPTQSRLVHIPVQYGGPDLEALAKAKKLSIGEVIALHSTAEYTVRLLGFSPGFPYLAGLDPRLHTPRKDSPRNRIEPGSVAIGGPHTGIYSIASPGGWHIIGRTKLPLFSPDDAEGPSIEPGKVFLLSPGDRVQFEPKDHL